MFEPEFEYLTVCGNESPFANYTLFKGIGDCDAAFSVVLNDS